MRLRVFTMIGQVLVFRVAQALVLRRMGWTAIGDARARRRSSGSSSARSTTILDAEAHAMSRAARVLALLVAARPRRLLRQRRRRRCRAMSRAPTSTSRREGGGRRRRAAGRWPAHAVGRGRRPLPRSTMPTRRRRSPAPRRGWRRREAQLANSRPASAPEEIARASPPQLSEARTALQERRGRLPAQARAPREGRRRPVGGRRRQGRSATPPQAQVEAAERQLEVAELPARPEEIDAAERNVAAQEAALAQAQIALDRRHAHGAGGRRWSRRPSSSRANWSPPASRWSRSSPTPTARSASSCRRRGSPTVDARRARRGRLRRLRRRASTAEIDLRRHRGRVHAAGDLLEGQPREAGLPRRGAAARRGGGAEGRPAGRRHARRRPEPARERRADHRRHGLTKRFSGKTVGRPCRPHRQARRDRRLPRAERLRQDDDDPHDLRAAHARRRARAPASATTS